MDYNIPNIFLEAFGLKVSGVYNPEISEGAKYPDGLYTGMEIIEDSAQAKEMSFLGTPILSPITFLGGAYKKYRNDGSLDTGYQMQDFRLPATAVVDFDRSKNITTTSMNGGATVKEIYGFEDWQIRINGFFLLDPLHPQGHTTPLMQEQELFKWDELASSIGVLCELFDMRNISNIAIKRISIKSLRGKPNVRPFSIEALSDEATELFIRSGV